MSNPETINEKPGPVNPHRELAFMVGDTLEIYSNILQGIESRPQFTGHNLPWFLHLKATVSIMTDLKRLLQEYAKTNDAVNEYLLGGES